MKEAQVLLGDMNTYQPISENPTKQLEGQIKQALQKLEQMGQITNLEPLERKSEDSLIPRFYSRHKVHKDVVPLLTFVSLPGAPNYPLSKKLWKRLRYLIAYPVYSIKSEEHFLSKHKGITVETDEIIVSVEVTTLFTSIDPKLASQT